MDEILEYLQLKNHYYEKFHSITVKFLKKARNEQWADLEYTVDSRERILNIIRHFDLKIAKLFEDIETEEDLNMYREPVKTLLGDRDRWVNKIVQLDLELISRMDELKMDNIKSLKSIQEKKKIGNYSLPATDPPRKTRTPEKSH